MDKRDNKAIVPLLCWITAGVLAVWVLWLYLAHAGPAEMTMAPLNGAVLATAEDAALDLNAATEAELEELPGIGEVRARAIIDDREANGPFVYPEDLTRAKGIGEGILAGLLDQITTGGQDYAEDFSG